MCYTFLIGLRLWYKKVPIISVTDKIGATFFGAKLRPEPSTAIRPAFFTRPCVIFPRPASNRQIIHYATIHIVLPDSGYRPAGFPSTRLPYGKGEGDG